MQWNRRRQLTVLNDKADEGFDFVNIKLKLGSMEDFPVFRQNSGIIQNDQKPRRNHADDLAGRSERRQEPGDNDVRIQRDFHFFRLDRTALISSSISSKVMRSVPFRTDSY